MSVPVRDGNSTSMDGSPLRRRPRAVHLLYSESARNAEKEGRMQTVVARFKIIPGKEAGAEEAMKQQAAAVEAKEPGVLTYAFNRNRKDPLEITVSEIYADDSAFQAHGATEHMSAFRGHFGSLFDPATVKIERVERVAGFSR